VIVWLCGGFGIAALRQGLISRKSAGGARFLAKSRLAGAGGAAAYEGPRFWILATPAGQL
jgi:hypothetical protein